MIPNCSDQSDYVQSMTKTKLDNEKIDRIVLVYAEEETNLGLRRRDLSDQVWSMMKIRQDNDMSDPTSAVYVKNKTMLLRTIRSGVVFYEK